MLDLSRSDNAPRQVTGFLHREHDIYYQWIEGPEAEVDALFAKIMAVNGGAKSGQAAG